MGGYRRNMQRYAAAWCIVLHMPPTTTPISRAAIILSAAMRDLHNLPIEVAVREAYRPGGPTASELFLRITARRAS